MFMKEYDRKRKWNKLLHIEYPFYRGSQVTSWDLNCNTEFYVVRVD